MYFLFWMRGWRLFNMKLHLATKIPWLQKIQHLCSSACINKGTSNASNSSAMKIARATWYAIPLVDEKFNCVRLDVMGTWRDYDEFRRIFSSLVDKCGPMQTIWNSPIVLTRSAVWCSLGGPLLSHHIKHAPYWINRCDWPYLLEISQNSRGAWHEPAQIKHDLADLTGSVAILPVQILKIVVCINFIKYLFVPAWETDRLRLPFSVTVADSVCVFLG